MTLLNTPRHWFVWSEFPKIEPSSTENMEAQFRDWAFNILRHAQFHYRQSLVPKINGSRWAAFDPANNTWFASIGFDLLPSGELSVVAEHIRQHIQGGPYNFHHSNPWFPTIVLMSLSSDYEKLGLQIKKYYNARSFINQIIRDALSKIQEHQDVFLALRRKAVDDYAEHGKVIDYIEEYDRLIKKAFSDKRFFEIDDLSADYNPRQSYQYISPVFVQWFERILTSNSLVPADLPVFNIHPDDLPLFYTIAVGKYAIDHSIGDDPFLMPMMFLRLIMNCIPTATHLLRYYTHQAYPRRWKMHTNTFPTR